MAFFDTDSLNLDSASSALRVDVYSPFDISEGEAEYIRAEVESELVSYAKRNAYRSARWPLFAALGIADLILLGLLLAFVFINGDSSFLVFFWVFGVVFLAGPLAAVRLISVRRKSRWAESLLNTPVSAAFAGRSGDGSEAVNKVWSDLALAGSRRDLATLEESCRALRWEAGVRFYRRLRLGDRDGPGPRIASSQIHRVVHCRYRTAAEILFFVPYVRKASRLPQHSRHGRDRRSSFAGVETAFGRSPRRVSRGAAAYRRHRGCGR